MINKVAYRNGFYSLQNKREKVGRLWHILRKKDIVSIRLLKIVHVERKKKERDRNISNWSDRLMEIKFSKVKELGGWLQIIRIEAKMKKKIDCDLMYNNFNERYYYEI